MIKIDAQPPSGGCVLKHQYERNRTRVRPQPPSGGCVLKPSLEMVKMEVQQTSRLRAAVC